MKRLTLILVCLTLVGCLLLARPPAWAQSTETPTPSETPTETPTPAGTEAPTPSPTAGIYVYMTLQPSGQPGAIVYTVTAGEAAIFAEIAFLIVLALLALFLQIRSQR